MGLKFDPILGLAREADTNATSVNGVPLPEGTPGDGEGPFYDAATQRLVWASSGAGAGLADEKYVTVGWYASVSGTSGTVTPPANGSIVLDAFADAVDALAFEAGTDGKPNWTPATEADGTPITLTLAANGDWTASGTADPETFCIVYIYKVKLKYLDYTYTIEELGAGTDEVRAHEALYDHSQLHAQGTDQGLDAGGANAVTAAEAKAAYDHSQAAHAPAGAEANPDVVPQAEAEAGTAETERTWTALRVFQAIAAWVTANLGSAALRDVGTGAGTVAAGDDARLSDARTPTAHKASHATGQADALAAADIGAAAADHDHDGAYDPAGIAAVAVGSHESTYAHQAAFGDAAGKNTGTTAGTVAAGDDARFSDARTPTAHKTSHATGQADALAAADIGAAAADHNHTGTYDAAGTAASAVSAHTSALDHTKLHTQGTDQGLDTGGANAVTAAQAKTAYTHSQSTHAPADADRTTAANVEDAITGSDAVTDPTDAGVMAVIIGAVLKKITWDNVKAVLKTYCDTLYATEAYVDAAVAGIADATQLLLHLNADFADSSTFLRSVTNTGTVTIDTSIKKFGAGAAAFNGTDQYLSLTGLSNLPAAGDDFTFECFIYLASLPSDYKTILCVPLGAGTGNNPLQMGVWNDNKLYAFNNGGIVYSGSALSAETWYHVALVKDGTTWRLYLNGVSQGTITSDQSLAAYGTMLIGVKEDWYSGGAKAQYWPGKMDEIRWSSRAMYLSNFTPSAAEFGIEAPTPPVVLKWTFDGGGAAIASGAHGPQDVAVAGTITRATVLGKHGETLSVAFDIWKKAKASYSSISSADSIVASAKPTLTDANLYEDTTLTGWTTAVAVGDVLVAVADSGATSTWAQLILEIQPS